MLVGWICKHENGKKEIFRKKGWELVLYDSFFQEKFSEIILIKTISYIGFGCFR